MVNSMLKVHEVSLTYSPHSFSYASDEGLKYIDFSDETYFPFVLLSVNGFKPCERKFEDLMIHYCENLLGLGNWGKMNQEAYNAVKMKFESSKNEETKSRLRWFLTQFENGTYRGFRLDPKLREGITNHYMLNRFSSGTYFVTIIDDRRTKDTVAGHKRELDSISEKLLNDLKSGDYSLWESAMFTRHNLVETAINTRTIKLSIKAILISKLDQLIQSHSASVKKLRKKFENYSVTTENTYFGTKIYQRLHELQQILEPLENRLPEFTHLTNLVQKADGQVFTIDIKKIIRKIQHRNYMFSEEARKRISEISNNIDGTMGNFNGKIKDFGSQQYKSLKKQLNLTEDTNKKLKDLRRSLDRVTDIQDRETLRSIMIKRTENLPKLILVDNLFSTNYFVDEVSYLNIFFESRQIREVIEFLSKGFPFKL